MSDKVIDDEALQRFRSKTKACPSGCLLWQGSLVQEGYGMFKDKNKDYRAHRLALLIAGVDIPAGMVVDHICRVRHCVNVDHLRVVTNRINSIENSLGVSAINIRKTSALRELLSAREDAARYRAIRLRGCGAEVHGTGVIVHFSFPAVYQASFQADGIDAAIDAQRAGDV